jgi:hypothetical protein
MKATRRRKSKTAHLLGVGLDNEDGHQRLTTAHEFTIIGGSEETHGRMTETIIKTFEVLKTRGRPLRAVEPGELAEIIHNSTPR